MGIAVSSDGILLNSILPAHGSLLVLVVVLAAVLALYAALVAAVRCMVRKGRAVR